MFNYLLTATVYLTLVSSKALNNEYLPPSSSPNQHYEEPAKSVKEVVDNMLSPPSDASITIPAVAPTVDSKLKETPRMQDVSSKTLNNKYLPPSSSTNQPYEEPAKSVKEVVDNMLSPPSDASITLPAVAPTVDSKLKDTPRMQEVTSKALNNEYLPPSSSTHKPYEEPAKAVKEVVDNMPSSPSDASITLPAVAPTVDSKLKEVPSTQETFSKTLNNLYLPPSSSNLNKEPVKPVKEEIDNLLTPPSGLSSTLPTDTPSVQNKLKEIDITQEITQKENLVKPNVASKEEGVCKLLPPARPAEKKPKKENKNQVNIGEKEPKQPNEEENLVEPKSRPETKEEHIGQQKGYPPYGADVPENQLSIIAKPSKKRGIPCASCSIPGLV